MVWLFKPSNRQPRGGIQARNHVVHGVSGDWTVWVDKTNPPCISYVSTEPRNDIKFDLKDFIVDSVKEEYGITENMYLSIVFAGFEVWGGGDGLKANKFCAKVE